MYAKRACVCAWHARCVLQTAAAGSFGLAFAAHCYVALCRYASRWCQPRSALVTARLSAHMRSVPTGVVASAGIWRERRRTGPALLPPHYGYLSCKRHAPIHSQYPLGRGKQPCFLPIGMYVGGAQGRSCRIMLACKLCPTSLPQLVQLRMRCALGFAHDRLCKPTGSSMLVRHGACCGSLCCAMQTYI